jgi:amino acid transporter
MRSSAPVVKKLRTIQLAAVIFLTVSGGPYGLEPLLEQAGAGAALLLLIIVPAAWDIPTIFTILELNSMMPVTGGYYQWVKRALGLKYAFFEGWWTWLYTFADLAIYPVMFVQYLSFFFPEIETYKIPVCLTIIWVSAGINILGIVPVGKMSICLSIVVLIPFLVLVFVAINTHGSQFHFPEISFKGRPFAATGIGLYTVMWNFIGWDNVTTYAGEVQRPVKAYLVSIFIAFAAVFIIYFIAMFIAVNSGIDGAVLSEKGFPGLGMLLGGKWLGSLIALGGMASALGLYSAVLLSVSRIPEAMSSDRLLPKKLHALHPKFKSPYISILTCSIVVSFMIVWTFGELLIIDITLYGAALLLEYVALIRLRRKEAGTYRPFRIPLNVTGLIIMAVLPFTVYCIAMSAALIESGGTLKPILFALLALGSAQVAWLFAKARLNLKL